MAVDEDRPLDPSFERGETRYNDILLGVVPPNAFGEAHRRYMDSAPSAENFLGVLGAVAIAGEKKRVIVEFSDTRLDFDAIVEGLE